MYEFYKQFSFVIGFMVLVLLWDTVFKEKGTFYFLLIVLLGMLVLNSEKIGNWLTETFTFN